MSTYHATVRWARGADAFTGYHYSRGHEWVFDGGVVVPASASPHVVRAPWSVEAAVDPEEAFVAALSSCHMLFFLAFAAKAGYIVDAYDDPATGDLAKDATGKEVMTRVVLHPQVTFHGRAPSAEEYAALHHHAHEECYIANSVRSEVLVQPTMAVTPGA
jgi:organic hydroperoxide reductase OsmC/OhrA